MGNKESSSKATGRLFGLDVLVRTAGQQRGQIARRKRDAVMFEYDLRRLTTQANPYL